MTAGTLDERIENFVALKPNEQLRCALHDLKRVSWDPNYAIDMDVWHEPSDSANWCAVCFAGSVLAKTIGVSRLTDLSDGFFGLHRNVLYDRELELTMIALDAARIGTWSRALDIWPVDDKGREALACRLPVPPPYDDDPNGFVQALAEAADILEGAGY